MSRYTPESSKPVAAMCLLHCADLHEELAFFTETLGFKLGLIHPADDPRVAELNGYGLAVRLVRDENPSDTVLVIKSSEEALATKPRQSPGGTQLRWEKDTTPLELPPTQHQFEVRTLKDSAPWVIGRAGMHYRDPVPDMVHYHTVGFQLIYCVAGWVKLVYEDQGDEFYLRPGDCVTQPPEIRHRVLEASDGLEVIEIGVPAEHITTIDHDMSLPNSTVNRDRLFDGQRFCHHRLDDATHIDHRLPGLTARETGVAAATDGKACVHVVSPGTQALSTSNAEIRSSHDADILFSYVLSGSLAVEGQQLVTGDAFTLPPGDVYRFGNMSSDLSILEVSLPGVFKTKVIA